ncbi:hypothetical protein WSM22_38990 [Cytophagales bacterium WSM2-2]|nr:hypothetical protein WSM22_38990 [Cytophagales bacterium WSM2-2]
MQVISFTSALNPAPQSKVSFTEITRKGLHILSNFESDSADLLKQFESFKEFVDEQVAKLQLCKVGEAYHNFEGGGYTAVVCLAESHLSIHTWPDINYATFDVYLSNHSKDNSPKAEALYSAVLRYFNARVLYENLVDR